MKKILLLVGSLLLIWAVDAQPTTQASDIIVIPVSGQPTEMRYDWTPGTGGNNVLVVVSDATSSFTPVANNTYAATPSFSGADIGTGAGKSVCVFNNTSGLGTVSITGLTAGNEYRVQIFEYTGLAGAEAYNVFGSANNPISYRTFTSSGSWTPPTGVTSARVQTWGAGGGGGSSGGPTENGGSGGGGGAYSSGLVTGLTAGAKTVTVGTGGAGVSNNAAPNTGLDSWFGPDAMVANALVLAKGGAAGANNSTTPPTNGGAAASGLPSSGGVRVSGGNGGAGADQAGGGGGSSGGPNSTGAGIVGNNGSAGVTTVGGAGGAAVVGGGAGSDGQNEAINLPVPSGLFPGGGGGGTQDSNTSTSGPGADGLVIVSYTIVQATNVDFTAVTSASMTVNWTNGSGNRRLVIARQGSAVATDPTNSTPYTANSDWNNGSPTGTAIGAGFVVYDGTGSSFTMTNMVAGTYHFAIYEYNGASTSTAIYNLAEATGNRSLVTQASGVNITSPASTSLTVNWTNGSGNTGSGTNTGTGRIVIVKTAGASFTPANGTTYAAATNFTSGTDLDPGAGNARCVFNNTNATQTVGVTNLTANTAYTFQVYEYTGVGPGITYTLVTATDNPFNRSTVHGTQPANQATAATFSSITANSITYQVTTLGASPGASRMIVVSNAAITFDPADGISYSANTDFTAGIDLDAGANIVKVVGFGSGPFTITGLSGDVTYSFAAFEFNGAQGTGAENYRDTEFETTRNTEPTVQASWGAATGVTVSGITLNWTSGNGDRRIILMREGSAVDTDPTDLTLYAENQNWGTKGIANQEVGTGNFVVYEGAASTSIGITNLQAGTTYHFAIYEYNSNDGGVVTNTSRAAFLTPAATMSQATAADAAAPADFTVGAVTSKGGREIAGYWNSTNTTIEVVVPLASDPTLDLGTIQLQLRNTTPTAFVNIGGGLDVAGSGFRTITHADRVAGSKTISVSRANLIATAGFAEAATLKFTAILTDFSSNSKLGTESATNTVVDEVLPEIATPTVAFSDNGSGRETITITFTEPLGGLSNGAVPLIGTPGFSVSDPDGIRTSGATQYISASNTIVLESPNNGNWSIGLSMTYTAGGVGNIVRDVAGNEMATITKGTTDAIAPVLITGMVFNPNGGAAETITFQLSEELNLTEGQAVAGFTTSEGIGSAVYTGKGTTNTITLTSPGNGTWVDDDGSPILVTYTQSGAANNVKDLSNNQLANGTEGIQLRLVNIYSNNANTAQANASNTIFLQFVANRALSASPTAASFPGNNLGGQPYALSGTGTPGDPYIASVAASSVANGLVTFSITGQEVGKTTTITVTTNLSTVTVDKIAPNAPALPDFSDAQDNGPFNTDNYTSVNMGLDFSGLAGSVENNSTVRLYRAGPIQIGPSVTASGAGAWSIQVPSLAEGVYSITATATDAAGNVSPASTAISPFTIDNTAPLVSNITLPDANPNNTSSVDFTVIFNSPVYNVDVSDFAKNGTADGAVTNVVMNTPSNYTVTVSGISIQGTVGLDVVDDDTILDFADNELGGVGAGNGNFSSATQYSMVLPEPPNHVTNFLIDGPATTTTSMKLNWLDAVGSPAPSGYLITVERSGATALTPTDYTTPIAQQTDLINNTTGYLYVAPGIQTATFNSLLSGETYTYRIYPFTNSGTNSDYKTDGVVPSQTGATPVGSNVTFGVGAAGVSTVPTVGTTNINFQFWIWDVGNGQHDDNAPTKVSQIIIRRDLALDQIGNWTNAIQSAELSEAGIGETTGAPARIATGADITSNSITFSNLLTDAFGRISDNNFKYYNLKLTLKTSLLGGLPQTIDNLKFKFLLNKVDILLGAGSTLFAPTAVANIAAPDATVVVIATQLDFSTNPNPTQLVLAPITSASAAPDFSTAPVIRARDVNGNTDLNFGGANIINISSAIALSPSTLTMTNGVATVGSQYQDSGNGQLTASTTTLAANSLAPANGVSSAVTVNYSNLSTIASVAGSPNTNIPSTGTTLGSIQPYRFSITDDGGVGIGDGSPTRISQIVITKKASAAPIPDWRDILNIGVNGSSNNAGAIIWDGTTNYLNASVTVNQNNITISNMSSTSNPGDLGYVADGATKTYQLYVWVRPAMTGGLPATVDFMNFDFEVDPANITFLPQSSTISPAQLPINSGLLDVHVAATQLAFTTQPPSDVLVNTNLTVSPVVEARDVNGNRDLDYSPVTGVTVTNTGGLSMVSAPTSFSNGVLNFPGGFRYTQIGNGTLTVASSTIAVGQGAAPSSALSTGVTVRVGLAGTITAGGLTEPPFISSIADDNNIVNPLSGGTDVFDFVINDDPGGTPANQNDGNPTRIQSITIIQGGGNSTELSDWRQSIGSARLSDGTNTIFGTINAGSIVFGGIPNLLSTQLGHIIDDNSKTYTLRIWLKETLGGATPLPALADRIDGERFQFEVLATNVSTDTNGTSIISTENENSGVSNEVEVDATQINFLTPPTASVNVPLSPQVVASARDVNGNLDKEFTGNITATGNNPIDPGPFTTINNPTGNFAAGQKNYPANFQFTVGNGDVELTMTAGGISGTSPVISLLTSFDSWMYFDPTFSYAPRIDFVDKQEAVVTSTSQALARIILSDGGSATSTPSAFNPSPGSPNQAFHEDVDGSFTRIDDFTISLTNFGDIRKIALYASDGVTKIGSDITPAATVTFTGLGSSAYEAPDDDTYEFYIRASFNQTVTDLDQITMQITAVTHNGGSKFAEQKPVSPPPTIAGVDGAGAFGDSSPTTVNVLDVIATSLDFVTPGSAFAGINEPLGATVPVELPTTSGAIVHARDQFTNLDLEFNPTAASIAITDGEGQNIPSPAGFVSGILSLDGLVYPLAGDGTLQIVANTLDSSNPPGANTMAIPGQLVNVINVTATYNGNGVLTSPNIKGGSVNQVLFGVTFTPDNNSQTNAEPSLKKFIFTFDKPYEYPTGPVFKNFDVKESTTGSFGGSTTVTLTSATITKGASAAAGPGEFDQVIVEWAGVPRDLFDGSGNAVPLTYYLVADVDPTANISTPTLQPRLLDGGFGSLTDADIVTTQGTAVASPGGAVVGNIYQFASTRPPVLLAQTSSPFSGQLNVDPGITSIFLRFDVEVISLDGKAELFNRNTNTKVADLVAIPSATYNPAFPGVFTNTANPIEFQINFLGSLSFQADTVYYVTIKKGTFDNVNNVGQGISDSGLNYYGGISSNGTYYFKISSLDPPNLLNASQATPPFSNQRVGTFRTTFDQAGTAYYLVVNTGSPTPSASEIEFPLTYGAPLNIRASGSYTIDQINTAQTVTFATSLATLMVAGSTYDIWIFAKNDAQPTPVSSGFHYGGLASSFAINGTGPTLQFTVPASPPYSYFPNYTMCPDSYVTLSAPIILGENTNNEFASASVQDFYILLPTGFEFDGVNKPKVQLFGSDFAPHDPANDVKFINNTIVQVKFFNNGSLSRDLLVIKDLRLRAVAGSSGQIRKFAGTNMLGSNPVLANISTLPANVQKFINSFAADNTFVALNSSQDVTAIPDNYLDTSPLIPGAVRLIPQINPANDYGASFFSGTGVTDDKLTMSAVSLNSAFDITMLHTDPNGCLSQNSVQYLVYDHRSPISPELGASYLPTNPVPALAALAGTQQAIVNPNFPAPAPGATFTTGPVNPSGPGRINVDDLAGYKLIQLDADLPVNDAGQIMNRTSGWQPVVNSIPELVHSISTTNIPSSAVNNGAYREYQWDYSRVLNAKSNGFVTIDPYDNFRATNPTPTGNIFWRGGSLGRVEFTGLFQSTADLTVLVPFRQQVELFVPAIPLMEVASSNTSSFDTADGTINVSNSKTPDQQVNSNLYTQPGGYPGTPVFCEAGGVITLNGYPAASAGFSTGTFAMYDYRSFDFNTNSGTPLIAPAPASAFVDNGNGTATIDPTNLAIRNDYEDILITYVFKENNSPAIGTGYLIIRISPSPVAVFTTGLLCEDVNVQFTDGSTISDPSSTGVSFINGWAWNFGDPNSAQNTSSIQNPVHAYDQPGTYPNVELQVTSNWGCRSTNPLNPSPVPVVEPRTEALIIGGTPVVSFTFEGVSIADPMKFVSTSTVFANSTVASVDWNFGDTSPVVSSANAVDVFHNYTAPGIYSVNALVTSGLNCTANFSKEVVMVRKETPTDAVAYEKDFESDNADWQVVKEPGFAGTASWAWGAPTTSVITSPINGSNIWTTNLTGSYQPNERSYLYTTCLDMSQLLRPMISFNSMVQLATGDGVVLEYSTDNKNIADPTKAWNLLGDFIGSKESGVDWYNALALPSKPGNHPEVGDYGWSGVANEGWMESKHILDEIGLQSNVVFRFGIASINSTPTQDGFAIDNIRVGNRTRTILVENFTNKANPREDNGVVAEKRESDLLKVFNPGGAGTKLVKINYHVAFPATDPFNLDNPADPSARALYYNITETPLTRLDGFKNPGIAEDFFSKWGQTQYGIRTLQLAQAEINFTTSENGDGSLQIDVEVLPKVELAANTILHVAILEKGISTSDLTTDQAGMVVTGETEFEYIMKKMLPSALGTRFGNVAPSGQPLTFGPFNWYPEKSRMYAPADDIAVIVFLQNEDTKEILQSEIQDSNIADPPLVTGINRDAIAIERVGIYPNPADNEITVTIPTPAVNTIRLQLVNQLGVISNEGVFEQGEQSKSIYTKDLAAGIYFLRLGNGKDTVMKKVMIVHK